DLAVGLADARAHLRAVEVVGGHDQGVLAVVRVVARPDPHRSEAEAFVEASRRQVGETDLEGGLARPERLAHAQEREDHPRADALTPPGRIDREGGDVRLVDHHPHPGEADDLVADGVVAHDLVALAGHDVVRQPVVLDLLAVRIRRPGGREARPFDPLDGIQIGRPHRFEADPYGRSCDHRISPAAALAPRGKVTYDGTSSAMSANGSMPTAASRAAPRRSRAAAIPPRASSPAARAAADASGRSTPMTSAPR